MAELTKVFVWRNRRRGFLVVTAKNIEDAYEVIEKKHANWINYAQHHEPEQIPARSGELLYLQQRG